MIKGHHDPLVNIDTSVLFFIDHIANAAYYSIPLLVQALTVCAADLDVWHS